MVVSPFHLTVSMEGTYVGCALFGSIVGVMGSGRLEGVGRKRALLLSSILYAVSAVGCTVSNSFAALVLYRVIGGAGIGISAVVAPAYINEIAPARHRGRLVSLYQLTITVGFLAAYVVNYSLLEYSQTADGIREGLFAKVFVDECWRGMLFVETLAADLLGTPSGTGRSWRRFWPITGRRFGRIFAGRTGKLFWLFRFIFYFCIRTTLYTMDQKDRIVAQAMQMFVSEGIKSVRMDDIARQLGVSKRTLYELFGDKESLLYLAMEHWFECKRLERERAGAGAGNVLEAMFRVLDCVLNDSESIHRVLNSLRKFYPAVYDRLMSEGAAKSRRDLRQMLERGIADGLFVAAINIELAISVLYYTASAVTDRKDLLLPDGMSEREAYLQVVSTFFRGISTPEGLRLVDDYRKRYVSPACGVPKS